MRALLLGPRDGWAASLVGVNAPLQGGVACPFGVFIHRCAGHGKGWGRGDLVEDAVLLTSEVVTNAIVHAGTDLVVTVGLDGPRARVAVRDDDVTAPRKREPTLESGRGLTLVEALAGSWGTFSYGDGKAVWFEL